MKRCRSLVSTSLRGFGTLAPSQHTPYRLVLKPTYDPPSPQHFVSDSNKGALLSPWHDIPISVPGSEAFYFVCTLPVGATFVQSLSLGLPFNPLAQEYTGVHSRGKERRLGLKTLVNHGSLPQTWEDNEALDEITGKRGAGTPLTLLEIGARAQSAGSVSSVKILGCLPVVEKDRSSWKVWRIPPPPPPPFVGASTGVATPPSSHSFPTSFHNNSTQRTRNTPSSDTCGSRLRPPCLAFDLRYNRRV